MGESFLTNVGRKKDLEDIKKISPKTYETILDEGMHGRSDDADLHLIAVRLKIWEKGMKER